jgi:FMN reductase
MPDVVTIAGSPTQPSRSSALLSHTRDLLTARGLTSSAIHVRDLPAEALLTAQSDDPAIRIALELVAEARAVIIATPVYKASYTGVLKAFLDLFPQRALSEKIVLPIVTAGSSAHLLVIDYAFKPVLSALGATHILNGLYIQDSQIEYKNGFTLEASIEARLEESLQTLVTLLRPEPEFAQAK